MDSRERQPLPATAHPCTAMAVRRLARKVTQIYDDALAPHGLTIGQIGLLTALQRRQGISVGALAERLAADASTVSRLLKPLANAALLTLEPDPDDRRSRLVRLTEAGHARRAAAMPGWQAAQARVAATLGDGRLAALRFLLDDAYQRL